MKLKWLIKYFKPYIELRNYSQSESHFLISVTPILQRMNDAQVYNTMQTAQETANI